MRPSTLARWLCGAAVTLAALGVTGAASADGGVALERLYPAPAGDRMFGVQSPFVAGERAAHVMLFLDYAHNPLVLARDADGGTSGAVVGHQLFFHASGTLSLFSRMAIHVDVPAALVQSGDDPSMGDADILQSPSSAQIGDIRVGVRVRLFGGYFDALQLALGAYLWLPSGNDKAGSFVGDGAARGMPQLIAGGRSDRFVWSAAIGPEFRPSQIYGEVVQGTTLHGGAGLGFLLGEQRGLQIGPELTFATVLEDANRRTTNSELLLGMKYRFASSFEVGLGTGLGLTSGVGTPDFRGVATLAYTPEMERAHVDRDKDAIVDASDACPDVAGVANVDAKKHGCPKPPPPPDRDKDSILDEVDACPDVAGVTNDDAKKHGCPKPPPPPDRDKDSILDEVDACPDIAGAANDDAKKNGCPKDVDNDGILNAEDACVDVPGVRSADLSANGCPGDMDGDLIRDDKDACPRERGKADPDPKQNGCPKSVRVTESEIIILQQVQFDTGKATIKQVSDALLDEVADVLKDHPDIIRIEVQGHTDDRGQPRYNEMLSQSRAAAVMVALSTRGIDSSRLSAKGYGQSAPIADNKFEAGRQQNRRVQFKIIEKAPNK